MVAKRVALIAALAGVAIAQSGPSSYPHDYPGMPSGAYSTAWQSYFEVTDPLPNITFDIGRNWAGNIDVQRPGHPNNTLFFWGFEKSNGSFTDENSNEPWAIWLNGGPGSSSLLAILFENGPFQIASDYSAFQSNYSWTQLTDYIWIDQPVGTGFSTVDGKGYVTDEDEMGTDFFGFLDNLVKVFPGLATRPLYLTGESYAGTFIPYITKTYFGLSNPPVKLAKIAIGDGTLGSSETFELLPTVSTIQTFPQIIGYDPVVFNYFKEQEHLCGYDLNLTYPQTGGYFPSLNFTSGDDPKKKGKTSKDGKKLKRQGALADVKARYAKSAPGTLSKRDREEKRDLWKRNLSHRANGSIDPWYGCHIYDEMIDYAVNFSYPWSLGDFDNYYIPDALNPEVLVDYGVFLNNDNTRAAIHAPTSKDWVESIDYPFDDSDPYSDPSVEPMAFLTDLASNATQNNVGIVIYSGNADSLVAHRGTEVCIQNTTFGGIQGFTMKPSTPWFNDLGEFAGLVHQERNWTYALVQGAGHEVPAYQPASAYTFLREFVLGNNKTGTVVSESSDVVGGQNSTFLDADYVVAQPGIYYGSRTTQSTYFYPSATIAAWEEFIGTATTTSPASSSTSKKSAGVRLSVAGLTVPIGAVFVLSSFFVLLL